MGYKPYPNEPEEYYDITFPTRQGSYTARFERNVDDIYVCDLEDMYWAGLLTDSMPRQGHLKNTVHPKQKISAFQERQIEMIREQTNRRGFQSLEYLYTGIRNGYIKNSPFSASDVRRAIEHSTATVSELRGKTTHRPHHGLMLGDKLQERELVLHGDIFFL